MKFVKGDILYNRNRSIEILAAEAGFYIYKDNTDKQNKSKPCEEVELRYKKEKIVKLKRTFNTSPSEIEHFLRNEFPGGIFDEKYKKIYSVKVDIVVHHVVG